MGLDMFLSSKLYIGANHEHNKVSGKIELTRDGQPLDIDLSRLREMVFAEAYWRKANAIHKWFVDNVQEGVDKCQESYVSEEQLIDLRDTCQQVLDRSKLVKGQVQNGYIFKDGETIPNLEEGELLADTSLAEELLPTTSGFFFGSTEYSQWYIQDLRDTVEQIDAVLKRNEDKEVSYYYQASW